MHAEAMDAMCSSLCLCLPLWVLYCIHVLARLDPMLTVSLSAATLSLAAAAALALSMAATLATLAFSLISSERANASAT